MKTNKNRLYIYIYSFKPVAALEGNVLSGEKGAAGRRPKRLCAVQWRRYPGYLRPVRRSVAEHRWFHYKSTSIVETEHWWLCFFSSFADRMRSCSDGGSDYHQPDSTSPACLLCPVVVLFFLLLCYIRTFWFRQQASIILVWDLHHNLHNLSRNRLYNLIRLCLVILPHVHLLFIIGLLYNPTILIFVKRPLSNFDLVWYSRFTEPKLVVKEILLHKSFLQKTLLLFILPREWERLEPLGVYDWWRFRSFSRVFCNICLDLTVMSGVK